MLKLIASKHVYSRAFISRHLLLSPSAWETKQAQSSRKAHRDASIVTRQRFKCEEENVSELKQTNASGPI